MGSIPTPVIAVKGNGEAGYSGNVLASIVVVLLVAVRTPPNRSEGAQAAWILSQLRLRYDGACEFTTDWKEWLRSDRQILLAWEAFVSGSAHSDSHVRDAATAATFFAETEEKLETDVTTEHPLSLIAVAAIWSGWSDNIEELYTAPLAVRPAAS